MPDSGLSNVVETSTSATSETSAITEPVTTTPVQPEAVSTPVEGANEYPSRGCDRKSVGAVADDVCSLSWERTRRGRRTEPRRAKRARTCESSKRRDDVVTRAGGADDPDGADPTADGGS